MINSNSRRSRERGQEIVEFAMILPILFTLLMGIFDMGRIVFCDTVLYNAAREGARYGVVNSTDVSVGADIVTTVRAWVVGLDPDALTITSVVNPDADTVQVTITYEFAPVTPLIADFFNSDPVIITAQSTMRIEG